jgi:integrase
VTGRGGKAAEPAAYPGLLAKLMGAVRPEFRGTVLMFDPRDPVFGAPPCRVDGCERPVRTHGMCDGHAHRWKNAGRPDLEGFAAATDPRMRGYRTLEACRVPGCGYGRFTRGLCNRHARRWKRAGRPGVEQWAAVAAPAGLRGVTPACCQLPACELWAQPGAALCVQHGDRWARRGRPDIAEFARICHDGPVLASERLDLHALGPQLRLEIQYVVQCRRDEQRIKIKPELLHGIVGFLAGSGVGSLLDWPEPTWRQRLQDAGMRGRPRHLLIRARRQVEDLACGLGWDVEYPREVWRLRTLGAQGGSQVNLSFAGIRQPWLQDLAKRWARWRLSSGLSATTVTAEVRVLTRFARFLAGPAAGVGGLGQLDRALLERYLADLRTEYAGNDIHNNHVGSLNAFLTAIRQHGWDDSLPANAMFFPEDFAKPAQKLPRALAEHVMAQIEHPGNLARFTDPAYRLVTLILIRCGLRLTDAVRLPYDCLAYDADGAPYLRYFNHKMKREALVPIDAELHQQVRDQQQRVLHVHPAGVPVLFPRRTANVDGSRPLGGGGYRLALDQWLADCDIRDEHGHPVHLTPHQWRHTLGTRLINRDVPQEVVRKILDHDSAAMTAHYARLSDTTVRRHWEQARKVNARGEEVTLDAGGPLADAAWAKQQLSRATQALPNGYCGLPPQQSCPHANSCLTCPVFVTTAEFLPQHRQQHQQTLQIISAAEARGQQRLAEMNRQVAGNLEKIITSLEGQPGRQEAAADAC